MKLSDVALVLVSIAIGVIATGTVVMVAIGPQLEPGDCDRPQIVLFPNDGEPTPRFLWVTTIGCVIPPVLLGLFAFFFLLPEFGEWLERVLSRRARTRAVLRALDQSAEDSIIRMLIERNP